MVKFRKPESGLRLPGGRGEGSGGCTAGSDKNALKIRML